MEIETEVKTDECEKRNFAWGYGYPFGEGRWFSDGDYANRFELGYERMLSDAHMKIAILEAEKDSDRKDIEVYKALKHEIDKVSDKLDHRCEAQAVYNATNTTVVSGIQKQIDVLKGLTKVIIPNDSVVPGWDDANSLTNVTI